MASILATPAIAATLPPYSTWSIVLLACLQSESIHDSATAAAEPAGAEPVVEATATASASAPAGAGTAAVDAPTDGETLEDDDAVVSTQQLLGIVFRQSWLQVHGPALAVGFCWTHYVDRPSLRMSSEAGCSRDHQRAVAEGRGRRVTAKVQGELDGRGGIRCVQSRGSLASCLRPSLPASLPVRASKLICV
jgi:hypothetical protein